MLKRKLVRRNGRASVGYGVRGTKSLIALKAKAANEQKKSVRLDPI